MANPSDLDIGNFSKPLLSSSPTEAAFKEAESKLEADTKRDEALVKPMLTYEERLKEAGVTKEEAADIVDAVLLRGFYSKEYAITKRIKLRLRTRNARDTRRAQDMLEGMRLTHTNHYNEMFTRFLFAASLESFGNDKLTHPDKDTKSDDIEKLYMARLEYVERMADPAMRLGFGKLQTFDLMIAAVLEEGTVENF